MPLRWRRPLLTAVALIAASVLPAQTVATSQRAAAPSASQAPEGGPACGPIDFTQSSSPTPVAQTSIACILLDGSDFHFDTSWWRAFRLSDYGVEGDFTVCEIVMAVEIADDGAGAGQPMTVNLWLNSEECPFPGGTRTLVGTTTITITDQSLSTLTVPVVGTVPALSELAVEIHVPDGVAQSDVFFAGSNEAGQTEPTYWSSVECQVPQPIDLADVGAGFPDSHVIMQVVGDQGILGPKGIEPDSKGNGVIELGETIEIHTLYKNLTANTFGLVGSVTGISAPAGYTGTILDANSSFGSIPAGQTRSCEDDVDDCYMIRYDRAGFGHRDGTLDEDLATVTVEAPVGDPNLVRSRTMHIGGSFLDVPTTHNFYSFIETILHNRVTGGCAIPESYCPGDTTLRKQMAVFLLKALLGACYVPPPAAGVFADVPPADPFAPWIEDLADRGITGGCGAGVYCPDDPVKRKQMAVFLLKSLLGSAYTPPPATGIFDDVPADAFQPWIEDLYNRAITGGCAGGPPPAPISYCPENPVTRGQMAVFLTKTFDLLLYLP